MSFVYIPRYGIAKSYGKQCFNFLETAKLFQSGYIDMISRCNAYMISSCNLPFTSNKEDMSYIISMLSDLI